VFRLVLFSFLLACISIPTFFADDHTTVVSFPSVAVLLGAPQFRSGHLRFSAYARG